MRAIVSLLIGICLLTAQSGKKSADGESHYRVYRGDGRPSSLDELIRESMAATVTFLGESHDDPTAHYLEEQILRRAYKPDLALSLEMFETDVQYVLNEYLAGLITEDHLIASGRAWKNYKTDYRAMIEFAKERKMPVIAANAPRRYVNRVSRLGATKLTDLDSEARRFLPPLPHAKASPKYAGKFHRVMEEARREQEKRAAESGEKKSATASRPFNPENGIEAQSLWDAGMAYSIADFLAGNPGMRVLHCNGSFHTAERLGILDHLARYRPGVSMLVVTMLSSSSFPGFDLEKMRGQGDFVIVTDPNLPRTMESPSAPKPAEAPKK